MLMTMLLLIVFVLMGMTMMIRIRRTFPTARHPQRSKTAIYPRSNQQ